METFIYFSYFFFFISLGYLAGTTIEKIHYRNIEREEKRYLKLPVVSSEKIEEKSCILDAQLCVASVVISLDYFKRFLASLRKIIGGRVKTYETLLDRGRREAILRMKKKVAQMGADMILNLRFETSGIGQLTKNKGNIGCFEVLVYGTAVKLKK
jgi:uncharacterized protein YbjQ (UPF0145 family)